jgi:hypothetical protein
MLSSVWKQVNIMKKYRYRFQGYDHSKCFKARNIETGANIKEL